jgi:hypothetical protein
MIWVFILGVIVLMVVSPGFRKLGLALLGIGAMLFALLFIYNESTKDPLGEKRARLAGCVLDLPPGWTGLGLGEQRVPYAGDTGHWNEQQMDRGIQLCKADLATYRSREKAETNRKLGLGSPPVK